MIDKNNVRSRLFGLSAVSAFAAGILTHGFALTNVIQNYDNINASFNGFGCGVESGRWFLTLVSMVMHKFFGGYNLPWFNGLVTILLLSISAALITHIFQFKKRTSAVLTGILFVVFPTVSSTLFFRFVSMYDAAAVLLAVFSAYIIQKTKYGFAISAICTALSMGIYQAYFPMSVTILVLLLLQMLLKGTSASVVIKKGVFFLCSLIVNLATYLIAQKLTQTILGTELLDYQGISQMGKIQLTEIPDLIIRAYYIFLTFPLRNYCGLTPNFFASAAVITIWLLGLLAVIIVLVIRKAKVLQYWLTSCMLLLLPIAIGLIEIMAPDSSVYTLMVYSYVFVFIAPLIILEELLSSASFAPRQLRAIVGAALILLSLVGVNYGYLDNVNYTSMYYATKQTENYLNALIVQVRMTEGFRSDQEWAFIGASFHDPLIASEWANTPRYGGNDASYINAYSRMRWVNTYLGYDIPLVDEDTLQTLSESDRVRQMPCFPDYGSIQIIDNVVVIKLENENVN